MKFNYSILLVLAVFWVQTSHCQYTDIINTNRPGESFGAFSVGKTIVQAEGGLSYLSEKYNPDDSKIKGFLVDLDIRYGFWKEQLEFIADLQYRNENYSVPDVESMRRSYMETTTLGFKYLFYDPFRNYEEKINIYSWKANNRFKWRQFIPVISIYAGANFNFSSNPYVPEDESIITPKAVLIFQNHFSGGWVFVTNVIGDHIGSDYQTMGGIFTVTKSLNDRWSGFFEIQGYKSDFHKDMVTRAGGVYLLNENTQLDVSLGKNFNNSRNIIYGGLGVSWRFTLNYKDTVMYRITEEESKEPPTLNEEVSADGEEIPVDGEEAPVEEGGTNENNENSNDNNNSPDEEEEDDE